MKRLSVFLICFLSLILIANECFAKSSSSRSSSSSSRSSVSRPSSIGSSSSRPASSGSGVWGGSKPSKPAATPTPKPLPETPSKTWGGSKPSTTPTTQTPRTSTQSARDKQIAEQKIKYDSAKATGKAFPSKEAAIQDWKKKNTGKYESKFATEPSVKPSYIPNTYTGSNGYSAPISYNQQYGGYGYMDALGTFILWDALTDIAFQDNQIQQAGYYIGNPPTAPPVAPTTPSTITPVTPYTEKDHSLIPFIIVSFIIFAILGGIILYRYM